MKTSKEKIIIIEGYDFLRETIARVLSEKYEVFKCSDCAQAAKIAERDDVKTVLCDIDAINIKNETIKKRFFDCRDKRFILTSTKELEKNLFDFSFNYMFIRKPYEPEKLISLIENEVMRSK